MFFKKRNLWMLLVVIPVLFFLITKAFASNDWVLSEAVTSPYDGRKYTREHWTRFWISPYGYDQGINDNTEFIGAMYCSVFDYPNDMSQGYTAVTRFDQNQSFNRNRYKEIRDKFLLPYGIEKDSNTDAWLVSPSYYVQNGKFSPFSRQSGALYDVNITQTSEGPFIPSDKYIPSKSYCITNNPNTFMAGAYYYGKPKYWSGTGSDFTGTYGEVNITQEAAASFFTDQQSTSANIIISFPYGLTVTSLELEERGEKVGDKDKWVATVVNTTPFIAKQVKLRAYKHEDGEDIYQIGSTTVDINPTLPNSKDMGSIEYLIDVPVSDKPYDLVVTANMEVEHGATAVNSNTVTKEPLYTNYEYNNSGSLFSGRPETVVWSNAPAGHNGYGAVGGPYDDNWLSGRQSVGGKIDKPPLDDTPANLSVADIKICTTNGNPIGGTIEEGHSYNVVVTYNSTFDISGYAKIGLFYKSDSGSVRRIGDDVYHNFSPEETYEKTYRFNAASGEGTLIGTVGLNWRGGTNFTNMKFEGETETTYDDNKKEISTAVTDSGITPPKPEQYQSVLYYHPVKEQSKPVYKIITEKVWKPDVRKIPYTVDDRKAKTKAILVK